MTGYKSDDVVGKLTCSVLQSVDTDTKALEALMNEIRAKRSASSLLVNKSKSGEIFTNSLVVYPLCTDSRISYYLGLTLHSKLGKPIPHGISHATNDATLASQIKNSSITSGEMNSQATNTEAVVPTSGLSIANKTRTQYDLMGVLAGKVGTGVGVTISLPTTTV